MWSISVPTSGVSPPANLSPTFTAQVHCGSLPPSCRWCPIGTTEKPVQLPTSRSLFTLTKTFFFQNKVIYTGCIFGPRICGWPSSCVSWWKPQIWALNSDPWLTGDIPLAVMWLRKASWPARWRASCLTWHLRLRSCWPKRWSWGWQKTFHSGPILSGLSVLTFLIL